VLWHGVVAIPGVDHGYLVHSVWLDPELGVSRGGIATVRAARPLGSAGRGQGTGSKGPLGGRVVPGCGGGGGHAAHHDSRLARRGRRSRSGAVEGGGRSPGSDEGAPVLRG